MFLYQTCHLSRYAMYRGIEIWIDEHGLLKKDSIGKTVGGISPLIIRYPHIKWEITNIEPYRSKEQLEWFVSDIVPDENLILSQEKVDIEKLPWDDKSVDIIIADQVLEHVPHPWIAAKEMCRVLSDDGILIASTTFLSKWHGPNHYFNFSVQGLDILFGEYLKEKTINGWGNKLANQMINFDKNIKNLKVEGNPTLTKLAHNNDELCPFVVWVCGRK